MLLLGCQGLICSSEGPALSDLLSLAKSIKSLNMTERSEQELVRLSKLEELRKSGYPYPNDVKLNGDSATVINAAANGDFTSSFIIAGRLVQIRNMGKAAFAHLLDTAGKIQLYIKKDNLGEDGFKAFEQCDIGDIVEARGTPFVTKTGERSLQVTALRLLSKCLIPLPEKWHGLTDIEERYRKRYLDLISNPEVRDVFRMRSKVIQFTRNFLDSRGYIEVETPVLHPIAGGTIAKPFKTHYNALHSDYFLRIALELPLKKLVVGGLERVYEIGRNFRNEGLSRRHNPEFTMLEFYQAYATFEDLMDLTETFCSQISKTVTGGHLVKFGEKEIDFTPPYPRYSMLESIHHLGGVAREIDLHSLAGVQAAATTHKVKLEEPSDWGRSLEALFGELVEPKLINPTFITHQPLAISPLARKNLANPRVVDRFEIFVAGMELGNAYSELNDPIDQLERFEAQASRKAGGDAEACDIDHDFVRALEYGMPPTAGQGIGIDRLVMLLTNSQSIRDVILFPQLKPEGLEG